jgi:hypothetical protein
LKKEKEYGRRECCCDWAASGAMWAVVTMLLVVVVVAVLYFGGFFNRSQKKSIDININKPGGVSSTIDLKPELAPRLLFMTRRR